MKYLIKFSLIVLCYLFTMTNAFSQFNFKVSTGGKLNGGGFGFKKNNLNIMINLQHINLSTYYLETGEEYNWDAGTFLDYKYEYDVSLGLFLPTLSIKYHVFNKNKISAYFMLGYMKPMVMSKLEINTGDAEQDAQMIEEFKKYRKSFSLWSGEIGFGTEYFFDENFSIAGEFGLRSFTVRYKQEDEVTNWDPNTGEESASTRTTFIKSNLTPTYTKFSLNFYF